MAEDTKIQWAHHTFNMWRGCSKTDNPGCDNCYAAAMSKRNPATLGVWGDDGTRVVASESMWKKPLKWNQDAQDAAFNGSALPKQRTRVFCASLADVFELRPLTEWRDICEGYRISMRGEIESQWRAGGSRGDWKPMKPKTDKGGYLTIQLRKHPLLGDKTLKVHRLMLHAFIGDAPGNMVVRHLDGNRSNNVLWNLTYSTQSENLSDRSRHGTDITGEKNGRSKLTPSDVSEIRKRLQAGDSQSSIASDFGVKQVAISRIKLKQSWSPDREPADQPNRNIVPGQMIDSSGRPLFASDEGWSHAPKGDSAYWRPLTMADVRRRLFALIDATPHLDWLLVTKRPENIRKMWPQKSISDAARMWGKPGGHNVAIYRENVWLLTSVSDQETANRNIPLLLQCRDLSPVLGASYEPALGPVDFTSYLGGQCPQHPDSSITRLHNSKDEPWSHYCDDCCDETGGNNYPIRGVDWIIGGGESGPKSRPYYLEWSDDVRRQCRNADVAFFHKQLGSHARTSNANLYEFPLSVDLIDDGLGEGLAAGCRVSTNDPKGGEIMEWPEELRVREFPR